jgi:hypothetical protein
MIYVFQVNTTGNQNINENLKPHINQTSEHEFNQEKALL